MGLRHRFHNWLYRYAYDNGVVIRTVPTVRGETNRSVPYVPSNHDRYDSYLDRVRRTERLAIGNNFPWKWRTK